MSAEVAAQMGVPLAQGLTGVKVLLEGPSGTGKTHQFGSFVDWAEANGVEVFVLFTERGLETLLGYWTDKGKPVPKNLHWHDLVLQPVSLKQQLAAAQNVGKLTFQSIVSLTDADRGTNNPFEKLLTVCSDFVDQRTGERFGGIDTWGPDKAFLCDSLSEVANAINKMVIGSKPTMNQGEYGLAQNILMNWLRMTTQGCKCHFVLTAHVAREKDEITGGIKLMTRAIGAAIAGDIPPLFSEVIYTVREGTNWYWDTANAAVDVKMRYLPVSSKIVPGFAQILDKWKVRAAGTKPGPVTSA